MRAVLVVMLLLLHKPSALADGPNFRVILEENPAFQINVCNNKNNPSWSVYKLAPECSDDVCKPYVEPEKEPLSDVNVRELPDGNEGRTLDITPILPSFRVLEETRNFNNPDVCGFEEVACYESFMGPRYSDPFPNIFSKQRNGRVFLGDLHENIENHEFRFIDTSVSPIIDENRLENLTTEHGQSVVLVDVKIDFRNAWGLAACIADKPDSAITVPRNCIVIEYHNDKGDYILGLVPDNKSWVCPTSAEYSYSTPFELKTADQLNLFKSGIFQALTGEDLGFQAENVDILSGDKGFQVSARTGERLSVIDDKLREIVNVDLKFDSTDDENTLYQFTLRLNGWISRQSTDRAGDWRMPDDGYYKTFGSRLNGAVKLTHDNLCGPSSESSKDENSSDLFFRMKYPCN